MKNNRTYIKINSVAYDKTMLFDYCHEKSGNISTPDWEKDIFVFLKDWLNEKDYVAVKTSGSTGQPKSIALKKSWMEYSARQTCQYFDINPRSTLLLCLPASYIAGKMMIVRAIVAGCELKTTAPTGNPFANLKQIVDFAAITPFQLYQSLKNLSQNSLVKTLIVGGGQISPTLEKQLAKLETSVFATYGMTETSSHISLRKLNGNNPETRFTVIGNSTIQVDKRGCLTITNPDLFDGILVTNDLVRVYDEKTFEWLGRYDNIINSGGVKIVPEEVENTIGKIYSQPVIISSLNDDKLGEAVVLVSKSISPNDKEKASIAKAINSQHIAYAVPRHYIALDDFPLTPGGKTDRKAIKMIIQMMPDK